jgi:hypothetical protein
MRVLATVGALAIGLSADANAELGMTLTELKCEFGYVSSAVAHPDTKYFAAATGRATEDDFVTFYNIDLVTGRAQVSGLKVDSEMVLVSERRTNWTFTEFTERGDTYVTEVFREFEPGAENGVYRVVRSKQWTEFGSVYGQQFYGVCAVSD